jgi:ElaB/YqjD/DUF883 family membrane-anchored ribosome-binding protein
MISRKLKKQRRPMERIVSNLKQEVQQAEEFLRSTAENSGQQLGDLRHRLKNAVESAQGAVEDAEDKVVACARATKRTMGEHILESVGIALGVGLVLGIVLGRK